MNSLGKGRFGSTTQVVRNLLIINIAVYFLSIFIWQFFRPDIIDNIYNNLGLHNFKAKDFKPYQLITHMFLHAYENPVTGRIMIFHILFNMFGLWMFGKVLENVLGSKKFFLLYFTAGIGAAIIHMFVMHIQISSFLELKDLFDNAPTYDTFIIIVDKYYGSNPPQDILILMDKWGYDSNNVTYINSAIYEVARIEYWYVERSITVGASGAVFGILAAFTVLFPNVELMLIFFPVPIKAKYLVPGYAVLELIFGVANFKGDNIAHFAHLGGALFGLILVLIWKRGQFRRY